MSDYEKNDNVDLSKISEGDFVYFGDFEYKVSHISKEKDVFDVHVDGEYNSTKHLKDGQCVTEGYTDITGTRKVKRYVNKCVSCGSSFIKKEEVKDA